MLATPRQDRFVSEYLVDLNATRAAIASGYSPHTAKNQASRLLAHVNVKAAVRQKQIEAEERLQIQRDDVIRGLISAAKEAKQLSDPAGMINAYREIGRMLGYYESRQVSSENIEELSAADITEMSEKELFKLSGLERLAISVDSADDWLIT